MFSEDFLWSNGRNRTFAECLRKYYYQYYASFDSDNGECVFRLKKLQNRFEMRSKILKSVITSVLNDLKAGENFTKEHYISEAVKSFKSAANDYVETYEKYYGLSKKIDYLEFFFETGMLIENFFCSEYYNLLLNKNYNCFYFPSESPNIDFIAIAGKRVYGFPDLIYMDNSETLIFDWVCVKPVETNDPTISDSGKIKAAIAYLYAEKNYFIQSISGVKYYSCNLYKKKYFLIPLTKKNIEEAKKNVKLSISKMTIAAS
nr:hypothetical protein [bacterium]